VETIVCFWQSKNAVEKQLLTNEMPNKSVHTLAQQIRTGLNRPRWRIPCAPQRTALGSWLQLVNLPLKNPLVELPPVPQCGRTNNQGTGVTVASNRNLRLFYLLILVFLLSAAVEPVQSQTSERGIHVTGAWSGAFPRLPEPKYDNMAFDVYVAGNCYYFAVDEHLGSRRSDYLTATSDGMDSFEMWLPRSWVQPGQLQPVFTQTTNYEQANSWARSGVFPVGQHACVQAFWLAFAYPFQTNVTLESPTNIPFRLMADDDFVRPGDWIVEPQYGTSADGKSLKRLRIYHPGHGEDRAQVGKYVNTEPAYTNAWLRIEYECLEETNVNGVTVPLLFTYKEFLEAQHREATNRDDVELAFVITGRVADVSSDVPLPSEYPLIAKTGHSTCDDLRILSFDAKPKFLNLLDDGGFLTRGTPRFTVALNEAKEDVQRHESAKRRFVPVFFLLLLPLIPILWYQTKQRRKLSEQT
jgi:hypothetical protein